MFSENKVSRLLPEPDEAAAAAQPDVTVREAEPSCRFVPICPPPGRRNGPPAPCRRCTLLTTPVVETDRGSGDGGQSRGAVLSPAGVIPPSPSFDSSRTSGSADPPPQRSTITENAKCAHLDARVFVLGGPVCVRLRARGTPNFRGARVAAPRGPRSALKEKVSVLRCTESPTRAEGEGG